jgi:hypothetical protein
VDGLEVVNGRAGVKVYLGRRAVHLEQTSGLSVDDNPLAILKSTDFKNWNIKTEATCSPTRGTNSCNRGFIGLAFRVQDHGSRGEYFYLRPTNGRADDQLRRNHSVQYESAPDFSWKRLRTETP